MAIRRFRRSRYPHFRKHRRIHHGMRRFHRRRHHLRKFRYRGGFQDFFVRQTYDIPSNSTLQITLLFEGFKELSALKDIYEAYKFLTCTVKITPKINVSSATSQVDHYVCAPYHKYISNPKTLSAENILSLDKSREYHGASTSTRRYVPAIVEATSSVSLPDPDKAPEDTSLCRLKYRPRIEIRGSDSIKIPHFCGIYSFGGGSSYQVTIRSRVRMYNQKLSGLF